MLVFSHFVSTTVKQVNFAINVEIQIHTGLEVKGDDTQTGGFADYSDIVEAC